MIVHIFEPSIQVRLMVYPFTIFIFVKSCVRLCNHMDTLSRKHVHCKFIRMPAACSGIAIDRAGFPVLSIYR